MSKGLLVVYSGPSGVGKSTILKEVFKNKDLNLVFSVSMTTRNKREGEVEGKDYFFVNKKTFEKAIDDNKFLEHACYVDNYYGTPKDYVEKQRLLGKNVILEIDVQGGLQVIEKCPDAISIFIMPPSIETLEERLKGRKTEKQEVIDKRVNEAKREIKEGEVYKYHIVNNDLNKAILDVVDAIKDNMK